MIATKTKTLFGLAQHIGRSAFEGFCRLLWPLVCDNCRRSILQSHGRFCLDCWDGLLAAAAGDYCPRCGRDVSKYAHLASGCPKCQDIELHFDGIARAGVYTGAIRDLILKFKFEDRTEFADMLGAIAGAALEGSSFGDDIDLFVPVPLHWIRRLGRGYNQSMLLCRALGVSGCRIDTDLVRTRYTRKQWTLTPAKRHSNVAGAFTVRKGHKFSTANVCLVDDITTSAATLNECAKTLKQAGVKKVFALVVAVAMQDFKN